MVRSYSAQSIRWGAETTEGTEVNAARLFAALGVEISPEANIDVFRARGYNPPNIATLLSEYTTGDLSGRPDFNEIVYPLASVLVNVAPAVNTNAYTWVFQPANQGADSARTFTIDYGDATTAERVNGARITDFSIHIAPDACELSGSLIAKRLQTGVTMNASPTGLTQAVLVPSYCSVYLDNTNANLGVTKLTAAFDYTAGISNRWGPFFVIDSAVAPSYKATAQTELDSDFSLQCEAAGAVYTDLMAAMRAGTTKFLRMSAIGPQIQSGVNYTLNIDAAVKVAGSPSYDEAQGIVAATFPFKLFADATWGKYLSITVINTTSGL